MTFLGHDLVVATFLFCSIGTTIILKVLKIICLNESVYLILRWLLDLKTLKANKSVFPWWSNGRATIWSYEGIICVWSVLFDASRIFVVACDLQLLIHAWFSLRRGNGLCHENWTLVWSRTTSPSCWLVPRDRYFEVPNIRGALMLSASVGLSAW